MSDYKFRPTQRLLDEARIFEYHDDPLMEEICERLRDVMKHKEQLENLTHYAKKACEAFYDKGDINASIEELEEAVNDIR
jgi:deoxyhypusine synthase